MWSSTNVTILDCRFENLTTGVMISHSVVNISYSDFESCRSGVSMQRLEYKSVDPGTLIANNSFYRTDYCVNVYGNFGGLTWNGVTIVNNSMTYYQRGVGIYGGGYDFTIMANRFSWGNGFAVDASQMIESTITENTMYYYSEGGGISISDSRDTEIKGNWIETTGPAICIDWSRDIEVGYNSIGSYSGSGISPVAFGVIVENSISVNVTHNAITERSVGVMILSSGAGNSTVWVHHNAFYWNLAHAVDNSGSENRWDDGVGEGNYWDDYDGSDGDLDGIGDTPKVIDEDSADNYPLMGTPQ